MPPVERFICRFAAEPPQEALPHGDWAQTLQTEFLAACLRIDADGQEIGEAGELRWFPDRTWNRRTYVPVTARTTSGLELFGYVSFIAGDPEGSGSEAEPSSFRSTADFTDETAEANPEWTLDLSDDVLGEWRGGQGRPGEIALVWGVALVPNGAVATAELGPTSTDQCILVENRFTLVSLDNFTGDYLEVKLWGAGGGELAAESLYEE